MTPSIEEIKEQIMKGKAAIKQLRLVAKEYNHMAAELAKLNSDLIKQLKEIT